MKKRTSPQELLFAVLLFVGWSETVALQISSLKRGSVRFSSRPTNRRGNQSKTSSNTVKTFNTATTNAVFSSLSDSARSPEGDERSFTSSFLYDGLGGNDGLLNYLPNQGHDMPHKTKRLVRRMTSEYIYGIENRPQVDGADILAVIEAEYAPLSSAVSVRLGNRTLWQGGEEEERIVINILSFAVLYQLPKEIASRLLSSFTQSGDNKLIAEIQKDFEQLGWEAISFPKGLGIRVNPNLMVSLLGKQGSKSSFFPPSRVPWRSRSTRKAAEAAKEGVMNTAAVQPPEQNIMSKEEFLVEIENEMRSSQIPSGLPTSKPKKGPSRFSLEGTPLPSFPESYRAWTRVKRAMMDSPKNALSRNKSWIRLSTAMDSQYAKIKEAGRAGFMAYAFINFVLYTVGIAWQWRRIATDMPGPGTTLVSLTLKKLGKAFARVYVGASLFKLVRIVVALALAPAAGRVLQFTQRKLGVSENAAFAILITLLLKTFFGTITAVILGDSALRKTIPTTRPTSGIIQEVASSIVTSKMPTIVV